MPAARQGDAQGNRLMKPWYEVTEEDQKAMMDATTWNYADLGYFRGGGYSSRFVTDCQMPMTMIRLNLVAGSGPCCRSPKAGRFSCLKK